MAKNITVAGASYTGVPAVKLPVTGGGTATFYDCVGSETKTQNGTYDVTGLAQLVVNVAGGGGGLPTGIAAIDFGDVVVETAFSTTRKTYSHKLGATPDFVFVFATANVATTYSELWAMRGSFLNYRDGYNCFVGYHGNSTTTVTVLNSGSTTYGVSGFTDTTFQMSSHSSSYYWRAGTYKYIAIKFA